MAAEGGGGGGGGGEDMTPSSSPKSRLKILCSHGGKILPRPADGNLKYVGGETRVIALSRDITFSELMKKLTALFDKDMVLKYQLTPEDLDALVSVKTDDDLRHMLDEYDRQENGGGSPRLRAFLFPSTPIIIENQMADPPHAIEQRYIDAINGIIRANSNVKLNPINSNRPSFSISSACSSPKTLSPDKYTTNSINQESIFSNRMQSSRIPHMHKVRSSPSLSSLSDQNGNNNNNNNNHSNHHIHHQHHHHYYHNHYSHSHHSSKPPQDPHKSNNVSEILASPLSNIRVDNLKSQMGYGSDYYHSSTRSNHRGSGCGGTNKFGDVDNFSAYGYKRFDRAGSVPHSPRRAFWE